MNRKELNEHIGQMLMQLAGALQAESNRGARAFLERNHSLSTHVINKLRGEVTEDIKD